MESASKVAAMFADPSKGLEMIDDDPVKAALMQRHLMNEPMYGRWVTVGACDVGTGSRWVPMMWALGHGGCLCCGRLAGVNVNK